MRMLLACVAAISLAAPALAQAPHFEKYQRSKYQMLDRSMEALLDDGYAIVNMTAGPSGVGFLLRRDNKWVVCSTKGVEQKDQTIFGSQCVALN